MRLLLVEDDPRLAELAAQYLRKSGYSVDVAATGEEALRNARMNEYDVAVLDLMLPDMDGMEVCRRLRAEKYPVRVLMATARDGVEDRIAGLDIGADDYLVKPYALAELVARIRALMRRPADALPTILEVQDLRLDTGSRTGARATRTFSLTTKEYAVLEALMRHPGVVMTREHLSSHAWDENYDPASNVIDVYVARLRKKVDGEGEVALLETIRGAGYRLGPPKPAGR